LVVVVIRVTSAGAAHKYYFCVLFFKIAL
jgi:hypothetical protein